MHDYAYRPSLSINEAAAALATSEEGRQSFRNWFIGLHDQAQRGVNVGLTFVHDHLGVSIPVKELIPWCNDRKIPLGLLDPAWIPNPEPPRPTAHDLASERAAFATLVVAMARGKYGYDPTAKRNPATAQILADVERAGLEMSDATVLKYLRLAEDILRK